MAKHFLFRFWTKFWPTKNIFLNQFLLELIFQSYCLLVPTLSGHKFSDLPLLDQKTQKITKNIHKVNTFSFLNAYISPWICKFFIFFKKCVSRCFSYLSLSVWYEFWSIGEGVILVQYQKMPSLFLDFFQ